MDFKTVEEKWQKWWAADASLWRAEDNSTKPKKYILVEFPYPSGSGLHVGHAFSFTGGDVYARFKRMQGNNVLFPMGWDAFGLPTENYAIKMKKQPQQVTKENTDMFRSQMKKLAFSFDWSREIDTTDPNYYRWTQWIFIKLFEKGLAYKEEMPINWCPSCKIGLANEEVLQSRINGVGVCERCGTQVSRRNIKQWVVRISNYADRLIDGLKNTDFIEKVKMAQVNWIGKSEGAKIKFQILNFKFENEDKSYLEVFTTRPDTLYGATFMVISPEHKLANELAQNNKGIAEYQKVARSKSDLERTELNKDKTGIYSGLKAINPVNGQEIPIWISDFVLASYGTGAIMSVPGHDERDKEFAEKYDLPIVKVLDENDILINSSDWNGLSKEEAIKTSILYIKEKGIGEAKSNYHLRDWIFSRQHYWGEPIPMIDCPKCGWVPEKEENLPIELPKVEHYEPTDDGLSPLSRIAEFVNCKCPRCGGEAKRETDTMPNWAGSDWYYLAYCFADKLKNTKSGSNDIVDDIFSNSKKEIGYWAPVDVYIGGDEHNTLHLLYSRFIYQFLYDLGVLPTELPEPYKMRMSHGVILGPDNARMSKSKGNVIIPEIVADKYGVDVVRMYLMFMGPFTGTMAWNENTLMGVKRFLDKVEKLFNEFMGGESQDFELFASERNEMLISFNKKIKSITNDMESFGYNTAIAKLMELVNDLEKHKLDWCATEVEGLIKLLAPFAPYTAEELWSRMDSRFRGNDSGYSSVHVQSWPVADPQYLVEATITVMVAINGKTRDQLKISNQKIGMKDEILLMAKGLDKIIDRIKDKQIVKEIYIEGKMVNLVILD